MPGPVINIQIREVDSQHAMIRVPDLESEEEFKARFLAAHGKSFFRANLIKPIEGHNASKQIDTAPFKASDSRVRMLALNNLAGRIKIEIVAA